MENSQRMSADEFDSQVDKLHMLKASTIKVARLVLVDGLNHSEAARVAGVSRQNVSKYMIKVKALLSNYPGDWVLFNGWMPESLAVEVRAKIKAAMDAAEIIDKK